MENKKYLILTAILVLFASANIFAQVINLNGTSNGTTVTTCNATLYDSGGPTGQYQNSESYTITFCSDAGSTIEIDVIFFDTESGFDDFYIYDGPNTGSPLIVESSGDPGIEGQSFETTGTCATIRFTSDGSVQDAGFEIAIGCGFPCQDFTLDLVSPTLPVLPDTALYACPGIGTNFTVVGNYPNTGVNYDQSDATTVFTWTVMTIDAVVYTGAGMTTLPSTFTEPGGTFVSLTATDVNGCIYNFPDTVLVYVSVPPTFTGTVADQTIICPGEEVNYEGFVQVEPWIVTIPEIINECFCADDDHYQEPQCAEFVHTAFAPGQTITSVNDIEALCMELEHSYIGDLDMWITCPNGQTVDLISYPNGCGGTYFGEPIDNDGTPCTFPSGYGVQYHYCWTPTAASTISDECGSYSTMPSGNYLPEGNFSGLIGCPINGTWQICFRDNLGSDDGRVCDFVLQFADNVLPGEANMWQFQNTYDPDLFEWTGDGMEPNSGGTATANPVTSGDQIFTFTATDDFGCSFDTTVTVTVRPEDDPLCCIFPVTTAGPDDHVCDNQYTFNATMATGNTGSWALINGPGTVTWANQNSPHAIVTVNGWGSYEFEWTEQNGTPTCIDQDRVIIEFWPVPTTTFTYDPVLCFGDTITITYTGNMSATATFDWDFDGASVVSGSGIGPYEIYWNTAAMHSIELTVSENGCTSPDTLVNVLSPTELTHTLEIFNDPCFQSCEGRAEITVVGGTLPYDYSWGSPTNILPNLCAGNYTITVEDANGCTTGENFTITEPPQLVINSITPTNLTCYQSNDGTISVAASGGTGTLQILWSDMGYGPFDRTGLIAGNYCFTVTDENDCTVSDCVELTQPDELLVTISPNIAICEGQQTVIQAQGMGGTVPYTYLWDQGTGVYNPASSSLTLAPDTTTTFSVYVRDDHGCTSNYASMIVTVSPQMVIDTMLLRDNRCNGSCDGRAEIVMHGGLQPLQYSWGSDNHIYEGLCAGIYTVTVNDIIGCTVSEMFVIEEPSEITYTSSTHPASCFGYDDGDATIYVQGGTPPYNYQWPGVNDTTETLVTHAGTYTVTVADDHNCKIFVPFTITEPSDIFVLPLYDLTICQTQEVTLSTQATGGTPYSGIGYDYVWTGSDGSSWLGHTFEVSPEVTTEYSLVVYDSQGCFSDPVSSTITVHPPLEILSVLTSNDTVCSGDPAIVHVDVQGGNGGPYLMTLQDGSVVPSPFTVYPDTTTMYYVTLEDMCGTPSVTDSILIIARPKPGNVFVAEDVDGCPPFAAYFTEGTPDYAQTYLWDFGDNDYSEVKNPIHIYNEPGVYSVSLEVTDFFGCKSLRTIENMITIYQGPTALFEATPEVVSFLAPDVEFTNYSTDATDYYWFFGDGDSSLFVNPVHRYPTIGEYEVMLVAESLNDCTDTTTRVITVRNEFSFYFPTSFTPNGDGMNDCARPCGNGIDKNDFSLVIYDRWGNLVFETDKFDPEAPCDACTAGSWDGTRNGSRIKGDDILSNGMYHWYAEFKDWNGIVFKEQGVITLIR